MQLTLGSLWWMALREAHRHKVKHQVLTELSESHLVSITLTAGELASARFKDEGKEIEWKGRMYDIVSMKVEGGKVVLSCFDDNDETLMVLAMKKMTDENNNNPYNTILNEFELLAIDHFTKTEIPARPDLFTRLHFAEPAWRVPAFIPNVPTPPPDLC
ncbi:MAG: hypothetical protein IM638_09975 [Bacteroidetes bacterium]|nr:hypothetical protein [Bacteroidota bacterium]